MIEQIKNVTEIFLYTLSIIIVIYDIFAVILQQKKEFKKIGFVTITSVFRRWYEFALVPYLVGIILLGHFGVYKWNNLLSVNTSIIIFLYLAIPITIWFIAELILKKLEKNNSKFFNVCCKLWPIPMLIGLLVGSWWK